YLLGRMDAAVDAVRVRALDLTKNALHSTSAYGWAPQKIKDELDRALPGLLNTAFNAAKSSLDAPLKLLSKVASWTYDEMIADATTGTLDLGTVIRRVKDRAWAEVTTALKFNLKFNLNVGGMGVAITLPIEVPA